MVYAPAGPAVARGALFVRTASADTSAGCRPRARPRQLRQLSMTSYCLALGAFMSSSGIIGLLAFVTSERPLSPCVPVAAALTGMFFLFASSILLIYEAHLATTAVSDEMSFITTFGRRLAPREPSDARGVRR